jgi:hypothetical protein
LNRRSLPENLASKPSPQGFLTFVRNDMASLNEFRLAYGAISDVTEGRP